MIPAVSAGASFDGVVVQLVIALSILFRSATCFAGVAAPVPKFLGRVDTPGSSNARTVAVSPPYVYLGTDKNSAGPEFYVVHVANATGSTVVGSWEIDSDVSRIVVLGNLAYLATHHDRRELVILNVADKTAPAQVGVYDAPNNMNGNTVAVRGSTVYLGTDNNPGTRNHELYVLNAANPTNVVRLGSYNVDGDVNGISLDRTDAYLATSHNGRELSVLSVANPASITAKASYNTPGVADANAVSYCNGRAYLLTENGGGAPDFYVLEAPGVTLLGSTDLQSHNVDVALFRDRAYVAALDPDAALTIVDIGDPAQPVPLSTSAANGSGYGVAVDGARTYLATAANNRELQVFDTTHLLRPNLILIYTDDQDVNTIEHMPILQEKIIDRGVSFAQSFTTSPLCCPSRASLLTGQYPHNTGIRANFTPIGGAPKFVGKDASTIATWLQDAGYRTGIYGKYLNQYYQQCPPFTASCYVPPGWEEWHVFVEQSSYNYALTENDGSTVSYGATANDYSTDVLGAMAVEFIASADERPYFLFLSLHSPHTETGLAAVPAVAPRHQGRFAGLEPWRPASYDEADISDKPAWFAVQPRADAPFGLFNYRSWNDAWRISAVESLQAVDEAIGAIVDSLEAMLHADDTVVIFSSDNGFSWGEHRLWFQKSCGFEECLRVPLAIRYPRWGATPRTDSHLVINQDLAPTLAALADTTPASPVNGVSLIPILRGEVVPAWRNDFLFAIGDGTRERDFVGVRHARWKYLEFPATGEVELFDLETDPAELESLGSNPRPPYAALRSILHNRLRELLQQ